MINNHRKNSLLPLFIKNYRWEDCVERSSKADNSSTHAPSHYFSPHREEDGVRRGAPEGIQKQKNSRALRRRASCNNIKNKDLNYDGVARQNSSHTLFLSLAFLLALVVQLAEGMTPISKDKMTQITNGEAVTILPNERWDLRPGAQVTIYGE
ncbi:MAG: hypothetical protein LBL99_02860, partial [Holosporaceae bacterium]|nr:hypothetical protein [Holosporaceae bacterium]